MKAKTLIITIFLLKLPELKLKVVHCHFDHM